MSLDRIRRVTDLFVEGQELFLGMDDNQRDVIVWVKKLNSFEVEEARRDGVAARGLRLLELNKEDSPERMALQMQMDRWTDDQLREYRVGQQGDEIYLDAINDLEADENWGERVQMIRRMPQLLKDENAPEDDPRRKQLDEANSEYLTEIQTRVTKLRDTKLADLKGSTREDLEAEYFEAWASRASLDEFMGERRITEIFIALRDCKATKDGPRWNHSGCEHERLLNARSQVRELPEQVLEKISNLLEGITIPQREAGNSAAPANSSASSEPQSAAEVQSTGSTPDVMPPVAPTT